MAKKNGSVIEDTEDTEVLEAVRLDVPTSDVIISPTPEDEALIQEAPANLRTPEVRDHVRYVAEHAILHAIVQAAFTDDTADLYVEDPENAYGRFHVSHAGYDAGKSVGTFHFPED